MTPAGKRAAAGVLAVCTGAALWWALVPSSAPPSGLAPDLPITRGKANRQEDSRDPDAISRKKMAADWERLVVWLGSPPPPSPEEIRMRLVQLRKEWSEIDPHVRAEAISKLLEGGEDVATGLEFRVGVHGLLAEWPSLRVFLLDVLATSDPEAAAATASRILDSTQSADEYAIALRSLTRPDSGISRDELQSRFEALLARDEWQNSRGFAEALDLARFLGTPESARQLASWEGNPALKSLALDEFTAAHPGTMLRILGEDTALPGTTRANLMARARPEDAEQSAAVNHYLTSPDLPEAEAVAFLRAYPLRGATTGHRLYAESPAPYEFEQIRTGDRAALAQVEQWVNDPALENLRPEILALQQRLAEWIRQADE